MSTENIILEFLLADFTELKESKFKKNNQWQVISDEESKELDILTIACSIAESHIKPDKVEEGRAPLVVNRIENTLGIKKKEDYYLTSDLINSNDDKIQKYVQGYVGVFLVKDIEHDNIKYDVKVTIKSRYDEDENYNFLTYLLEQGNPELHNWNVPVNYDDIYEYMIVFIFFNKLKEAAKQGLYKTYQRFEKNDNRIKGYIDISRHIKQNMGLNNGSISYSYRENTCDNNINHLILFAYEHLRKKYPINIQGLVKSDSDVKDIITQIKNKALSFENANLRKVISKSLKPIAHPYYQKYEYLRFISLLILNNRGISIFGDKNEKVHGVLYYLPDLWEECIYKSLVRTNTSDNVFFQETLDVMGNKIRPDFVIKNNNKKFVLDAKFKPKWFEAVTQKKGKLNLYFLMDDYNKCIRDMDAYNANEVGVIFPCDSKQFEDVKNKDFPLCNAINQEHTPKCLSWSYPRSSLQSNEFHCYGVYIPRFDHKKTTYKEWKIMMDSQMMIAVSKINQ